MSEITAVPAAIEAFGDTAALMSAAVASAGSINAAANIAQMVPVFGLIGQEFLLAFAGAQASQVKLLQRAAKSSGVAHRRGGFWRDGMDRNKAGPRFRRIVSAGLIGTL